MKKFFFSLMLCLMCTPLVMAKTDANIFGHVIDSATGEHMPFVNVMIKGTSIGISTDATGHYFLKNLPLGESVVIAKSVGYTTEEVKVNLHKNQSLELNFKLKEDNFLLDEVVVSANKNETTRRLAPSLVNVIEAKKFEFSGSACLADGISLQPGVRLEDNCQNCGFTQVRINGLDGHYSQILIDSRPIFSSLTGVYGLEQIPANMIERVEVVRGGGSALFGSSAIGGTVNIITKTPSRNTADISHTLTSMGGSGSLDNVTMANASLVSGNNKAGAYIYGQLRNREGYDHNDDGYTEIPQIKSQSLGMRSFLRVNDLSKITVEYHGIHEFRRGGNKLNELPHKANIAEMIEHYINGGGINYDFISANRKHRLNLFTSLQSTSRDSYYGGTGDESPESIEAAENSYGKTEDLVVSSGAQYTLSFNHLWFLPAELTLGLEYNYDNLKDNALGSKIKTYQIIRNYSGFFQNEWKNDKWGLLIGGRFDKHNLVDKVIFSPRANVRFNPTKDINLRLSYGAGFRAPQAFDEDLHVSIASGELGVIELADDLTEEKSNSVSFSADYYKNFGNVKTNFLVEAFFTDLKDVFDLRRNEAADKDNLQYWERYNASGARVYGVTLEARVVPIEDLNIQTGWTIQRSRYKEATTWSEDAPAVKKMFRTPDVYGYLTINYSPIKHLMASVNATYTGKMLVQHLGETNVPTDIAVNTPDFFDMGIRVAYDIPMYDLMTLQVFAGVKNVFNAYQKDIDSGWNRDSAYIYGPGLPRSYFAGAKILF